MAFCSSRSVFWLLLLVASCTDLCVNSGASLHRSIIITKYNNSNCLWGRREHPLLSGIGQAAGVTTPSFCECRWKRWRREGLTRPNVPTDCWDVDLTNWDFLQLQDNLLNWQTCQQFNWGQNITCLLSLITLHIFSEINSHGGPQEGAGLLSTGSSGSLLASLLCRLPLPAGQWSQHFKSL